MTRLDLDGLADAALHGLGALMTAAFAGFVLTLAFALDVARAETVCAGTDLLTQMEANDPDGYMAMRQAANAEANGGAMLWRIEAPGGAVSHLYGTMHVTDPRIVTLAPGAQAAFETSSTLVIETTDIVDPAAMAAVMVEAPELMMFTDDTTLSSLMSEEERTVVAEGLDERGLSLAAVEKMKPWMIASTIALPGCERARQSAGEEILDVALALRAEAAGMEIAGLETAMEQLRAIDSLPLEFHMRGLVDTLALSDRLEDIFETMIVIHERGEPGLFWPFFDKALDLGGGEDASLAGFEDEIITARNHTMAERVTPFLDAGDAFVAIGALHLPGEEGVVALLEQAGYVLEPMTASD